jgi:hypothetical protein
MNNQPQSLVPPNIETVVEASHDHYRDAEENFAAALGSIDLGDDKWLKEHGLTEAMTDFRKWSKEQGERMEREAEEAKANQAIDERKIVKLEAEDDKAGQGNMGIVGAFKNLDKYAAFGRTDDGPGPDLVSDGKRWDTAKLFTCTPLVEANCRMHKDAEDRKNDAGSDRFVKSVINQCNRDYCHAFCLRVGMATCAIDTQKLKAEEASNEFAPLAEDPSIREALCAPVVARLCVAAKCCEKHDPFLHSWVEDKLYGDAVLTPRLPLPMCSEDKALWERSLRVPEDGGTLGPQSPPACEKCKSKISLTFDGYKSGVGLGVCTRMESYGTNSVVDPKTGKGVDGMEMLDPVLPPEGGPPRIMFPGWVITGTTYRSTREKCDEFVDVTTQKGFWSSWNTQIDGGQENPVGSPNQKICQCLGCCRAIDVNAKRDLEKDSCYFPLYGDDDVLNGEDYEAQKRKDKAP